MVSYFTNGKIGDSAVATDAIHNYHDIDLENCIILDHEDDVALAVSSMWSTIVYWYSSVSSFFV